MGPECVVRVQCMFLVSFIVALLEEVRLIHFFAKTVRPESVAV